MSSPLTLNDIANLIKGLQGEIRQNNEQFKFYKEQLEESKKRISALECANVDIIKAIDEFEQSNKKFNDFYRKNNLINLDINEQYLFSQYHVICLVETWVMSTEVNLPNYLNEFNLYMSRAVREKSRGRASGGLMVLVRKSISDVEIIENSNLYIVIKFSLGKEVVILGNVYLPPSADTDYCIESVDHLLFDIETKYPNCCYKIIGGDFNSRIGNLNSFDEELFEGLALCGERCASDGKVNARGKLLVEMMESYGMFVTNGRSPSDSPGNFTYISRSGCSIIDLVWTNLHTLSSIIDFSVVNSSLHSNHLLCLVSINLNNTLK